MDVRTAGPQDALAVETVRLTTWRVAYRGLVPQDFLDSLEPRERPAIPGVTTLLASDPDPVAMAAYGPSRDDDLDGLELYALYVLPERWGTGLGHHLLELAGDVRSLWVLEDNDRARGFYAAHGFRPDGSAKVLDLGAPVTEVRLVR